MKLGLVVRGEDRGLGNQVWEMFRHLRPERTLLIDMGDLARGFLVHAERYPGAVTAPFDGAALPEELVRDWLAGLDVVLTAETFYDARLVAWANEAGVATVIQVNPEFYREPDEPERRATALWAPSSWRLEHLPERTRPVPVPVATDRFAELLSSRHTPGEGEPLRVLHVAGHRTMGDRNGSQVVTRAAGLIRHPSHLTISGQDGRLPTIPRSRRGRMVTATSRPTSVADYWELYRDQDVLVLPRRFGGLSLPVQEALAAGLVPILSDIPPNRDWPAIFVPARSATPIVAPGGRIPTFTCRPVDVAAAIDRATDRAVLTERRSAAGAWVQAHAWTTLLPLYRAELARAVNPVQQKSELSPDQGC